jgi:hypothetical protein
MKLVLQIKTPGKNSVMLNPVFGIGCLKVHTIRFFQHCEVPNGPFRDKHFQKAYDSALMAVSLVFITVFSSR